jgi:K+-transporting ATPase KdpF subunit
MILASLRGPYARASDSEWTLDAEGSYIGLRNSPVGATHVRSQLRKFRRFSLYHNGHICARLPATLKKEREMYEPIIGLCVAILLGVYLVYALLHPEKF